MRRWYVVHTQPQAEARALWHLKNQGFSCFLPRLLQLRRCRHQTRQESVPLFPRYLFVCLDLDGTRWRAVNGTRGVVSLLANGPHPLAVPHGVVETLVAKADERGIVSLAAMGVLTKGLRVRIKCGAFGGQRGSISSLDAGSDRIIVLLRLLGKETKLPFPSYAIEAA